MKMILFSSLSGYYKCETDVATSTSCTYYINVRLQCFCVFLPLSFDSCRTLWDAMPQPAEQLTSRWN